MAKITAWLPGLEYDEELVGIECTKGEAVHRLIGVLWTTEFRTCPHHVIANTVIVPKVAAEHLPLNGIDCTTVDLHEFGALDKEVQVEIYRRFASRRTHEQPQYYTCGQGAQRTCCRYLVRLDTVQEIERTLRMSNNGYARVFTSNLRYRPHPCVRSRTGFSAAKTLDVCSLYLLSLRKADAAANREATTGRTGSADAPRCVR